MPVKRFVWDELSDNVLFETDENDEVTARYTNRPEQFGELISQERNGTKSYYHFDGMHSVNALTDENANVTDTFGYTAFGEEVWRTGTTENPFGYKGSVGYYTNSATNDLYVRARTYQPASGRWLSKDPIGFVDGPNLYVVYFVPNGIDPTGNRKVCCKLTHEVRGKKTWVRETECADGRSAHSCCSEFQGTFYRWKVVSAADKPCIRQCNPTRTAAGATACCAVVIAVPTDPSDIIGTPAGCVVAVGAGVTYLCCAKEIIKFPPIDIDIDWTEPPVPPRDPKPDWCYSEYEKCLRTVMSTWSGRQKNRCWKCYLACRALGFWKGRMNRLNCAYWNTLDLPGID